MFRFFKRWFRNRADQIPYDSVVTLEDALVWDCEVCTHRNYVDFVPMEPGAEEIETIREHNESDDGQVMQVERGDLLRAPYTVQCQKCRHVFAVGNHYDDLA